MEREQLEKVGEKLLAAEQALGSLSDELAPQAGDRVDAISRALEDAQAELRRAQGAAVSAEGAAQRERDLLYTIMENTRAQLAYLDPEFNFVRVNSAYAQGCGYRPEELIGRNHFCLFPDDENQAIFQRVWDTGEAVSFQAKPFVYPNQPELGTTYWDWTLTPVRDVRGRVQGLVLSLVDVTARTLAEDALRRYSIQLQILHDASHAILTAQSMEQMAEGVLRQVPNAMPCLRASVVAFDLEAGGISLLAVYAARETRLRQGWRGPMEEEWAWLVDKLARGEMHIVEDVQRLEPSSPVVRALQTEGVRAHVYTPLLVEGELVGSLNLGMREPGPLDPQQIAFAHELAGELAVGIRQMRLRETVQRHAEELEHQVRRRTTLLQLSEARFRAVFEEAALGIALLDPGGGVIASNPALQAMLGYSGDELRGRPFAGLVDPEDVPANDGLYEQLMSGQRDTYAEERRYLRQDGRPIYANVTLSLVHPTGGRPGFAIALVEDVTERKRAQEALIESEKLAVLGQLAASVAHEANNPLQSVLGCLGLAQEVLEEGGDVRQYIEIASDELERAVRVIAQMRDLGRPSRPGERRPTDVNLLVDKVLLLSQKRFRDAGVEVDWESGDDLPMPLLQPDQVQQVFLNLVLNAVDAMPDGGRLRVSTSRTDEPEGVSVSFTDTGMGIPPGMQERIFEPFESTKEHGMGLGLYVSRTVAEEHGGQIAVESQPGKGTTFTVWLPAE